MIRSNEAKRMKEQKRSSWPPALMSESSRVSVVKKVSVLTFIDSSSLFHGMSDMAPTSACVSGTEEIFVGRPTTTARSRRMSACACEEECMCA